MPTYEYECDKCRRVFEVRQRISEPALTVCDVCGGAVRRLLSPAPFILKGDGWYVTDYPSESRKKALEAEKKGTSPDKPAEKSEKSETKTETKTESVAASSGDKASGSGSPSTTSTTSPPPASS